MKKRTRAHEAGSIEAGSSKSKSIFFANRVDGALVGQPNRASWGAQERTKQLNQASEKARGSQIEPFEAGSTQQGRHYDGRWTYKFKSTYIVRYKSTYKLRYDL